jgi:hypothetical protein
MASRKPTPSIGALEDEIKRRDERIEELRQELDEQRDLIRRMEENVEDASNTIDSWAEAFGMVQTDDGAWTWEPFWEERLKMIDNYNALVRNWNKYVPLINGRTQPVGRPLAASDAQVAQVRKLRKAGRSLRWIADEMSLGLNTVRTIVAKDNGTDRTSRQEQERIDLRRQQLAWKREKRTGDALPKRAQRVVEEGHALLKEAKGLGR